MAPEPLPVWQANSGAQSILTFVFGAAALVTFLYCARTARQVGRPWPVFVAFGAGLAVIYEPMNNLLLHLGYPANQDTLITIFGRDIPIHIGFVYIFYFALPVTYLMRRFEAGITRNELARSYVVGLVLCAAFEPPFIQMDMWRYVGDQPLNFTGLPLFWWFVNATSVFATAAILQGLRVHVFTTAKQDALFVPFTTLGVMVGHAPATVPMIVALNSTSNHGWHIVGTFLSISLALCIMWMISKVACVPDDRPGGPEAVRPTPAADRASVRA
jgi:hypothetical protein